MRIPLAWLNLVHSKTRTALAVAGVAFAVVLIFMQLGFLGSAEQSASLVFDALDFDILVRSRHYLHLVSSRTFPLKRLDQVEAMPGVRRTAAIYLTSDFWRNPQNGNRRAMLVIGVDPSDDVFRVEDIQHKLALLTTPESVLIDCKSRREFGPSDGQRFGEADIGVEAELAQRSVQIAGCFTLGMGFVADGAAIIDLQGFQRMRPQQAPNEVSLGLVKLQPRANADAIAAALRNQLPGDVEILTRADVLSGEIRHWVWETSIGLIFQLGVVVAMVVGTAIVYQVLSSDVANHLPEYATLKAIGYSGRYLASVVLQQALALAVMGFLPGLAVSAALYALTRTAARIPMALTWTRVFFVLGLSIFMCTISGLGALRKVRSADPADLF